jgi:acyl dehydratase
MNGWDGIAAGKPKPGQAAERRRRTSLEDVQRFSAMTGDCNPLHYDAELAAATPFAGLIVQGGVTSGLLNAVVAEDLPGPGSVFLGVEWRFVKAVLVGEEIVARVEVASVRDDKPICNLVTTVRNGDGETCLTGTAVTYTVPLATAAISGSPTSASPSAKRSMTAGSEQKNKSLRP